MPRVSVLMSTYNVGSYIEQAVASILAQTFRDFEFLIIDDNSSDDTWARLERLALNDHRIYLFRNQSTVGLPASINRLVVEMSGEYVARMDGDDISTPDRFVKQVAALDGGDIDICGGAYIEFPTDRIKILGPPVEDDEAKIRLLFEWTLMHPTVMMRRGLLEREQYRTEAIPVADYDLWVRLARFARFRNLPDIVLLKRIHNNQISIHRAQDKEPSVARVRRMALQDVGVVATDYELYLQGRVWIAETPLSWNEVLDIEAWLVRLAGALQHYPAANLYLSRRWYKVCLKAARYGYKTYRLFQCSKLHHIHPYSRSEDLAIMALSLLRIPHQSLPYRLLYALRPSARDDRRRIKALGPEMLALLG